MQRTLKNASLENKKRLLEESTREETSNIDKDNIYDKNSTNKGKCLFNRLLKNSLNKLLREDEMVKSFLSTEYLSENDKDIIASYKENKVTKNMLIKYIDTRTQPVCRGKIHLLLFFISPIGFLYMLKISDTIASKTSSLMTNLCFLFNCFASALLHNFKWNYHQLFFIEKLDHFGIFLLICGSLLPVQFLLFEKKKLSICLTLQCVLILFGFCCTFFSYFSSSNRLVRSIIYLLTGFVQASFLRDYFIVLDNRELVYLITLSALYIIGAFIYALKKPNIIPGFFDFHEVFHMCCLGSALCTFALNCSVIKRVR